MPNRFQLFFGNASSLLCQAAFHAARRPSVSASAPRPPFDGARWSANKATPSLSRWAEIGTRTGSRLTPSSFSRRWTTGLTSLWKNLRAVLADQGFDASISAIWRFFARRDVTWKKGCACERTGAP